MNDIRFDEQMVMDANVDALDQKLWERFRTPLSPPDNNEFLEKLRLISHDEDGLFHPTVSKRVFIMDKRG